jgi:hypothetical protein
MNKFHGIVIDIGAAYKSTARYGQYLALSKLQDITIDNSQNNQTFKFGVGTEASIGTV